MGRLPETGRDAQRWIERRISARKGWARRRKEWDRYLSLHGHAEVLWAFVRIQDELDGSSYWRLLRDAWTRAEQFEPRGLWAALLSKHPGDRDAMMTVEERAVLDGLPEKVVVYRGAASLEHISGFSWTLDKERATWFAQRFASAEGRAARAVRLTHVDPLYQSDPVVATGLIAKSEVIAYIAERDEQEIVALHDSVAITVTEQL